MSNGRRPVALLAQLRGLWEGLEAIEDSGGTGGPHVHPVADVTGLQTALDAKQPVGDYAEADHGHAVGDVTGLQAALDGKQAAGSYSLANHDHDGDYALVGHDHSGVYQPVGSYAAATHSHIIADVTGLQTALDGKQAAGSYAAASHNHDGVYEPAGDYAAAAHSHGIADVTGLQSALDGKQASGSYSLTSHNHDAAYAPISHTHTIANVTGLQTALDGKQASGSYSLTSHNHSGLYEPVIAPGTTSQYWRGDKTWQEMPSGGGGGSLTSETASLGADVQLPSSNTFVDGPSVTLAAGTWLVMGTITFQRNATTAVHWIGRLSNGTTHYASSQAYQASVSGQTQSIGLSAIVVLAAQTAVKLQGATSAGSATSLMKAATPAAGSGNNATRINAVKIA